MIRGLFTIIRKDIWYLILLSVVALYLRLDLQQAVNFTIDSDEAIVGLMGMDILMGKGLPVFYYGQHYMGSLEPMCAAVLFALFGVSSVTLKWVPLFWSALLIPLVYSLGFVCAQSFCTQSTQAIRSDYPRAVARLATLFIAVAPAPLVIWSGMARGGFVEIVVITTLSLVSATRSILADMPRLRDTFVLGVVLGVGWWTNNQILFAMVAIGCGYLLTRPSLRLFGAGVSGFLVGSAPFWLYNLRNNWASFGLFQPARSIAENMDGFFAVALPTILGARRFWREDEIFIGATPLVYLLGAGVALSFLSTMLRDAILWRRVPRVALVLLIFVLSCCGIFIGSAFGTLVQAPRYLLPLYPVLAVIAATAIVPATRSSRFGRVFQSGVVVSILAVHLCSLYLGGRATPGEPHVFRGERVMRDHAPLYEWLSRNGVRAIRTNYWIGYRVAFETKQAVRFAVFGEPDQVRIKEYEEFAASLPVSEVPLVLTPRQGEMITRGLDALGVKYQSENVGGYTIISKLVGNALEVTPESERRRVEVLGVSASHQGGVSSKAIDNDSATRWGSGAPQDPSMSVTLGLPPGSAVSELTIDQGTWGTDYPRSLRVLCSDASSERVLLDESRYEALRYVHTFLLRRPGGTRSLTVVAPQGTRCDTIRLQQLASDPVFDWSIAEVTVYD